MRKSEIKRRLKSDKLFGKIAFWQFLGFLIMLAIVWISEIVDLPAIFFNLKIREVDVFRACILSAAVIISSIITVGHTYVQQKHIIRGLLIICSSCGKLKVSQDSWEDISQFLEQRSLAALSHGICPECYEKLMKVMDKQSSFSGK